MIDTELMQSIQADILAERVALARSALAGSMRVLPSRNLGPAEIVLVVGTEVFAKLTGEGEPDGRT